jgi:hypothetical protein
VVDLMPFNEFISALGGSLGFFLGISGLSTLLFIYEWLHQLWIKLRAYLATKTK